MAIFRVWRGNRKKIKLTEGRYLQSWNSHAQVECWVSVLRISPRSETLRISPKDEKFYRSYYPGGEPLEYLLLLEKDTSQTSVVMPPNRSASKNTHCQNDLLENFSLISWGMQ